MIEDTNVTAKEYRKMQKFLLLIAGCIALDQTLLSIVILLSLLMGLQIAWKERGSSQLRVWPRYLKWCLLLLLATGYVSLHNPLVTHGWSHVSGTVLRGKVLLPGRPLTRTACRFGKFLCASLFRCACCGFWAG